MGSAVFSKRDRSGIVDICSTLALYLYDQEKRYLDLYTICHLPASSKLVHGSSGQFGLIHEPAPESSSMESFAVCVDVRGVSILMHPACYQSQ